MWNEIEELTGDNPNVWKFVYKKIGAVAESVLYRYPTFEERTVICCSTMSGCPVGCRFCGAGDYFVKALSSEEIVSQVVHSLDVHDIDGNEVNKLQIMFMSMGEPMLNFRNLAQAICTLSARFPEAKLLISTIGPDVDYGPLRELSAVIPGVGLQFSVHEPTNEARGKLIPFKKKLDLAGIVREGEKWHAAVGRKPFFNYCAHEGNVSDRDADRLLSLFNPAVWEATISVVCERDELVCAANERQRELARDFSNSLLDREFNVRVFDPAGQDDIGGGCGQLWFVQQWMREHPEAARPSVGNGMQLRHAPGKVR